MPSAGPGVGIRSLALCSRSATQQRASKQPNLTAEFCSKFSPASFSAIANPCQLAFNLRQLPPRIRITRTGCCHLCSQRRQRTANIGLPICGTIDYALLALNDHAQ